MKLTILKIKILIVFLFISGFSYAQENELYEIVDGLRDDIINRANKAGHRFKENSDVVVIFFDEEQVFNIEELKKYSLSDIKEITLRFNKDPKIEVIYGTRTRYGVIYIVSEEEDEVKR